MREISFTAPPKMVWLSVLFIPIPCMFMYVFTYARMFVCMHVCMYGRMYVYIYVSMLHSVCAYTFDNYGRFSCCGQTKDEMSI